MKERFPMPTFDDGVKANRSFVCRGCGTEKALHPSSSQFNCLCGASTDVRSVTTWVADSKFSADVKPLVLRYKRS